MTLDGLGPLVCESEAGETYDVDVSAKEIESYLGRIEVYRTKIDALRGQ